MFQYEYSKHLIYLLGIPLLFVFLFLVLWFRKRTLARLADSGMLDYIMPGQSSGKIILKFILIAFAMVGLVLASANPQWGTKKQKVKRKSVDVFIALDISQSMLAEDIRPSRMIRAREFVVNLIDELRGERIGTILFAGNAYVQMPLTTDYTNAQLFIRSAHPNLAPTQGTVIADAIDMAIKSFKEEDKYHKALVLITDGENHEGEAIKKAKEAKDMGMIVYTVGVGTSNGAPIPVVENGRTAYKTDSRSEIVTSKLNEKMLRQIANAAGGEYYNLTQNPQIIPSLRKHIDKIEKREFEQRQFQEYNSYFQYFMAFALLLLILEFILSYRKTSRLKGNDIFKV